MNLFPWPPRRFSARHYGHPVATAAGHCTHRRCGTGTTWPAPPPLAPHLTPRSTEATRLGGQWDSTPTSTADGLARAYLEGSCFTVLGLCGRRKAAGQREGLAPPVERGGVMWPRWRRLCRGGGCRGRGTTGTMTLSRRRREQVSRQRVNLSVVSISISITRADVIW
jgi:hypothetical protein